MHYRLLNHNQLPTCCYTCFKHDLSQYLIETIPNILAVIQALTGTQLSIQKGFKTFFKDFSLTINIMKNQFYMIYL